MRYLCENHNVTEAQFLPIANEATRVAALFDGIVVSAPPRDPELEKHDETQGGAKTDRRKTAAHPRKGRRDVSALTFPRRTVEAPVNASKCESCGAEIAAARLAGQSGLIGEWRRAGYLHLTRKAKLDG